MQMTNNTNNTLIHQPGADLAEQASGLTPGLTQSLRDNG